MSSDGIAILGSTGSIGCNTLNVVESLGDEFGPVALDLLGQFFDVAPGGQRHDAEAPVAKRLDHAHRVAPDRAGRAEYRYALCVH
jgi:1-deoxy-D-xylulose 5-phosphate reductoisomerase